MIEYFLFVQLYYLDRTSKVECFTTAFYLILRQKFDENVPL
jgi:hypothetical protein